MTLSLLVACASEPPPPPPLPRTVVHALASPDGRTATAVLQITDSSGGAVVPAGTVLEVRLSARFGEPAYCSLRAPVAFAPGAPTAALQGAFDRPCVRPATPGQGNVVPMATLIAPDGRYRAADVDLPVPASLGGDERSAAERLAAEEQARQAATAAELSRGNAVAGVGAALEAEIAKLPAYAAAVPDPHGAVESACPPNLPRPGTASPTYGWRVDHARLARIARAVQGRTAADPLSPEEVGWEVLSGTAYDRLWQRLAGRLCDDAALLEELTHDPLFVVIRAADRRLPRLVSATTDTAVGTYEPGFFSGAVFVMDRATARPLCAAPIEERSSDSIVFDAARIGLQMDEVKYDFSRRLRRSIDAALSRIAPGIVQAPPAP